ncbi:hypothetical protein HDU99_001063 [Rhizoclosmatium hyalinum]|nr:hypothetical protein HDU99_001063 [Rhizoclosmatium hyalinum]
MKWLVSKDARRFSAAARNESKAVELVAQPVQIKLARFERRLRRWKRAARSELDCRNWARANFANLSFYIPDHLDTVERIDVDEVSDQDFVERFERDGVPCVITGVTKDWKAETEWTPQRLLDRFYNEKFKVGEDDDGKSVFLPFNYFMHYCTSGDAAKDDSPLYIFDPNFADRSRNNTAEDIKKRDKEKKEKKRQEKEKEKEKESKFDKEGKSGSIKSEPSSPEKRGRNSNTDGSDNQQEPPKRLKTIDRSSPAKSPEKEETSLKLTYKTPTSAPATTAPTEPISPTSEEIDIPPSRPTKEMLADYIIPRYFRSDLFQYTGSKRPPHRWVVIGPKRSGTGIHVDPLGTSAWNTLLTGHKRWALFPPEIPKNMVTMRGLPDHEAATWFVMVYPRLTDPSTIDASGKTLADRLGIINLIQRPGETVFVPGGWHHLVINLDFTVGVTQNFCSVANWETVWLKTRNSRPKMSLRLLKKLSSFVEHPREDALEDRLVYKGLVETAKMLETVPQLHWNLPHQIIIKKTQLSQILITKLLRNGTNQMTIRKM